MLKSQESRQMIGSLTATKRMIKQNTCINYFKDDFLGPESSKWQWHQKWVLRIKHQQIGISGIDRIELHRNQKVKDKKACDKYFKVGYLGPESSKWQSDTRNELSVSSINAPTLLAKPRHRPKSRGIDRIAYNPTDTSIVFSLN